jgi:hypothetical protein
VALGQVFSVNLNSTKFSILTITQGRYNRPIRGRCTEWTLFGIHLPLSELKKIKIKCHYRVQNRPSMAPLLCLLNSVHILIPNSLRLILTLYFRLCLLLPRGLFSSHFAIKFLSFLVWVLMHREGYTKKLPTSSLVLQRTD